MARKINLIRIGLATALSLLIITTFSIKPVYALTVDDLRESIGEARKNNWVTDQNDYTNVQNSIAISVNNSEEDSDNQSGITYESYYDEAYDIKFAELDGTLRQYLKDNTSSQYIVNVVDEIMGLDASQRNGYYVTGGISDSSADLSNLNLGVADSRPNIGSPNFSIGAIGSNSPSITDDFRDLVTPWGYMLNEDGTHSEKYLGVDFGVNTDTNIKSQWNGVVINIEKDDATSGNNITVYHGNNLYTKYSHVSPVTSLTAGTEVSQGDVIANGIDTTIDIPDKPSHVYYQVILDEEYINPLLAYGNGARVVYENWMRQTTDINVVEKDEEYFIETPIRPLSDFSYVAGNASEVLYPDFNLDGKPIESSGFYFPADDSEDE